MVGIQVGSSTTKFGCFLYKRSLHYLPLSLGVVDGKTALLLKRNEAVHKKISFLNMRKQADQLQDNHIADLRLCFCYIDYKNLSSLWTG